MSPRKIDRLSELTEEEIREAFKKQKENDVWDFYKEREFMENLLSQRFNFLILMYAIFVSAFATIQGTTSKIIILAVGALVILFVGLTIYRGYVKLIISLKILYSLWDDHVFRIIDKEARALGCKALVNVNPLIGIWIPLICFLTLVAGIIFISSGVWIVP